MWMRLAVKPTAMRLERTINSFTFTIAYAHRKRSRERKAVEKGTRKNRWLLLSISSNLQHEFEAGGT
jgi:hypothetical protein